MDNYQIAVGTPALAKMARRWLELDDQANPLWNRRCDLWDADMEDCAEDIEIGKALDVIEGEKADLRNEIAEYVYGMPEGYERYRLERELGDGIEWVMCQFANSFKEDE